MKGAIKKNDPYRPHLENLCSGAAKGFRGLWVDKEKELLICTLGAGRKLVTVNIYLTTLKMVLLESLNNYGEIGNLCGLSTEATMPSLRVQRHLAPKDEGESL